MKYNLPKFDSKKAAKKTEKNLQKPMSSCMHIAKNNGGRKRMQRA